MAEGGTVPGGFNDKNVKAILRRRKRTMQRRERGWGRRWR